MYDALCIIAPTPHPAAWSNPVSNHDTIHPTDRELTRAERRMLGRAEFDTAQTTRDGVAGLIHPSARDRFADAFAEITRPFGGR